MDENSQGMVEVILWGLKSLEGDMLTLEEVAEILEVSDVTVRRWTQSEGLPHVKIGGYIRVPRAALLAYLNQRAQGFRYVDPGYYTNPELPDDI